MDTIYALASGRGRAGVSVVRLSGARAFDVCRMLVGDLPTVRRASLRKVMWRGEIIDEALVTCFAAGHSFTGEEVVEFDLHGSVAVLAAVMAVLGAQPGLRSAEAGEFTRRALENGRLDLTQVEGLADLIDAETEAQRKQAQRVLSGALAQKTEVWRSKLIRAAALLEATIDFADEDVPVDVEPEVQALIWDVMSDLEKEFNASKLAERLRDGFEVAILGGPNAGKSTLINYLSGRSVALTSDVPGTTRDVLEVRMDLDGLPVTFLDTAGVRETEDEIERLGIERALDRARLADLRIYLLGGEADVRDALPPVPQDLVIYGKSDLGAPRECMAVSGRSGEGVAELLSSVSTILNRRVSTPATFIRQRHRDASVRARTSLTLALEELLIGRVELAAECIREAVLALDGLIGRVDVETLLGEIFSSFCIGK
jgi:tRNA modification GTPase